MSNEPRNTGSEPVRGRTDADDTTRRTTGSGATPVARGTTDHDGGSNWWKWLLGLLLLLALLALLFFVLGGDADVDTEGGDVDVQAPEVDADLDAPDVDADVDVEEGDAEAEVEGEPEGEVTE